MSKRDDVAAEAIKSAVTPAWDTTVKLGAIEEGGFAEPGDVVVKVDKASGELTRRRLCEKPPYGRSTGGL